MYKIISFAICFALSIIGCTPLHYAVDQNNLAGVEKALNEGTDIDETKLGWTPLMTATYHGNILIVEYLINEGADINLQMKNNREYRKFAGFTALHFAAYYGHLNIAKTLVDSGADTYIMDYKDYRAYDYARQYGFNDIAEYTDYTKATEINPRHSITHNKRGHRYYRQYQYDKAISEFNKAIEINPSDPAPYNNKAWLLATCTESKYRDGATAVELAKKAVELKPVGWYVDTLAAAYAEAGKFEDAIATQDKAIDLLKKEGMSNNVVDQAITRLNSYKAHKPWRKK